MAFKCPESGCEDSGKEFQTEAALKSHISSVHPEYEPGGGAREVPIVEEDFTTAELVGGKRTDIMRKASYGACDKAASRWASAIATLSLSGIIFPTASLRGKMK
jgi:hypothetical protein